MKDEDREYVNEEYKKHRKRMSQAMLSPPTKGNAMSKNLETFTFFRGIIQKTVESIDDAEKGNHDEECQYGDLG